MHIHHAGSHAGARRGHLFDQVDPPSRVSLCISGLIALATRPTNAGGRAAVCVCQWTSCTTGRGIITQSTDRLTDGFTEDRGPTHKYLLRVISKQTKISKRK